MLAEESEKKPSKHQYFTILALNNLYPMESVV